MPSSPRDNDLHVLLAGDSADVPTIRRMLRELPSDAYGQVIVEVAAPIQVVALPHPPGMTITWLHRAALTSDVRGAAGAVRGEAVSRALDAWVREWMPGASNAPETRLLIWVGCSSSPRVGAVYRMLRGRLEDSRVLPGELRD